MNVFRFPPIKCTVFPLVKKFDAVAMRISKALAASGISHIIDITGTSIERRYARTDEIGVPLAVTVDSMESVTIREQDRKEQIRVRVDEVASVVKEVMDSESTWANVVWQYTARSASSEDNE